MPFLRTSMVDYEGLGFATAFRFCAESPSEYRGINRRTCLEQTELVQAQYSIADRGYVMRERWAGLFTAIGETLHESVSTFRGAASALEVCRGKRLIVAAMAHGLGRTVVRRALEVATSRRQFGQTIATLQAIPHSLVEMQTLETGIRLFFENALSAAETRADATQEI